MSSPSLSSPPPPWSYGGLAREWGTIGRGHGVALAMPCSSMPTDRGTLSRRTPRVSRLFAVRYVESETTFPYVLKRLVTVHLAVMLAWGLLWYFGIRQVIETLRSFRRRRAVPTEQVLVILWLVLSYLAIFIGWRFPGHYHLAVLPPLSILAGQAFSRFVAEQRRFPRSRWRWIRASIIGAAALPAIGFLTVAFATRVQELD